MTTRKAKSKGQTKELKTLADLTPDPDNLNLGTQRGLSALDTSIRKFGVGRGIVTDKNGVVIGGNKTLERLADLGIGKVKFVHTNGDELVVNVRDDLDLASKRDRRARGLAIADNRVSELDYDPDEAALAQLMADERELVEGLYSDSEVTRLLQAAGLDGGGADAEPQIDRAEELRVKWGVESGQLWGLGEHRLLCGDSTVRADVERVMGGAKARMVFTDSPYNVSYQDNESVDSLKARNRRTDGLVVRNDSMTEKEFDNFLFLFLSELPLCNGGSFYLCAPPGRTETQFRNAIECVSGIELRECIVWVKDIFVFGRQDYHWRHESILYGWKNGAAHYFIDDHTQDTVWEFERPRNSKEHPTMKPVELPNKAIANSSLPGEVVFDGFGGSGTTMVVCNNLGRVCRMIELDPAYVAVALQRFQDAFNITPALIEHGNQKKSKRKAH